MAGSNLSGPTCQTRRSVNVVDGTLRRDSSPKPGVLRAHPKKSTLLGDLKLWSDHLAPPLGAASGASLNEEGWFENRYPNWLAHAREVYTVEINSWVQENWGATEYKGPSPRFNIYARGKYRNDNMFEKDGDRPQNFIEADKVLGSFSIDLATPVTVKYSHAKGGGKPSDTFSWETEFYVEDVLGLQEGDPIHNQFTGRLFPSRRVVRAKWKVTGGGAKAQREYEVRHGDTLSKIALAVYGKADLWKRIYEANKDRISNPNMIQPGQKLVLPPNPTDSSPPK
jgi:hypothetical protein